MENNKLIYLLILPYWDPMIPPMGISSLKSYLQDKGYNVKTEDLIVKNESLEFYDSYFEALRRIVPPDKQGNFFNIGHDVLQNHMMASQNYTDEEQYVNLVKILIFQHFYVDGNTEEIKRLNRIVEEFFKMLRNYLTEQYHKYLPAVVGVTAYKCTLPASLFALKLAKEIIPNVKTIMGGGTFNESHAPDSPSFETLLELSKDYLDKIMLGPGEFLLEAYLQDKLPNDKRVYTKEDIGDKIPSFEILKIPDFSDLDLMKYPCLSATASVSCVYECSFCTAKKVTGQYRTKLTAQLVDEMSEMSNLCGHQLFFMTDSLINPVITDISNEMIRRKRSLYYDAYFKVDDASALIQNTLLWRKGGLYRVRLGTESGSQTILDKMAKKITTSQIKSTLSALAYAGVKTTTYWVIGHPGETEEDFQKTLDLIAEMKDDIFQAECNYFLYHYSQQASNDEWAPHRMPLYPDWADKMLANKYWTLNLAPLREETFKRVHRFESHCRQLGIPNPYTYKEHIEADKRWRLLHKNAVPPLLSFLKRDMYIDENLSIELKDLVKANKFNIDEFAFD